LTGNRSLTSKSIYLLILLTLLITPFYFDLGLESRYSYRLSKETLMNIMIIIMLVIFIFDVLNHGGKSKVFRDIADSPFFMPFLVLIIAGVISLKMSSVFLFNSRDLLSLILGFCLFSLSIYFIDGSDRTDWIFQVIMFTGIVTGFYCIAQYFGFDPILKYRSYSDQFETGYMRVRGFIDNPNTVSSFLILIPAVSMADFLRKSKFGERIVPFLAMFLSITGLFLASSISGIISFLSSMGIFIFLVIKTGKGISRKLFYTITAILVLIVLSGIVLMLIEPHMYKGVIKILVQLDPEQSERLVIWKSALHMIHDEPIFGIGYGNFKVKYIDYRVKSMESGVFKGKWELADHAHNDYLHMTAESGILAFLGIIWLLIVLSKIVIETIKKESNQDYSKSGNHPDYLQFGLLASIISVGINALFVFPFHLGASACVTLIYGGILSRRFKLERRI